MVLKMPRVVFAILASSFCAVTEGRTTEILRTDSWANAVEKLSRTIRTGKIEYAADFVIYFDGSHDWLPLIKGSWNQVRTDEDNVRRVALLTRYSIGKAIARVCDIHTHPLRTIRIQYQLNGPNIPYSPPSIDDISIREARIDSETMEKARLGKDIMVYAIFDPHGIWYHRPLRSNGIIAQGASRELHKIRKEFKRASIAPNSNFLSLYRSLIDSYRVLAHTLIRFVSYEEATREPHCVGVDFDPLIPLSQN
jgi:hypothetical protein